MKPTFPNIKDKLIHNGVSQTERLLEALQPDYFKLDERSLKDIMAATYEYAKLTTYYNEENEIQGDWADFWEVESLTYLAVLSTIDTENVKDTYRFKEQTAREKVNNATTNKEAAKAYLLVIAYLKSLALQIEQHYSKLPDSLAFKREILTFIQRDRITDAEQLEGTLATLVSYHKDAYNQASDNDAALAHSAYKELFAPHWGIIDEPGFYEISDSDLYRKEEGWENLNRLFTKFHQALIQIQTRACFWFGLNCGNLMLLCF